MFVEPLNLLDEEQYTGPFDFVGMVGKHLDKNPFKKYSLGLPLMKGAFYIVSSHPYDEFEQWVNKFLSGQENKYSNTSYERKTSAKRFGKSPILDAGLIFQYWIKQTGGLNYVIITPTAKLRKKFDVVPKIAFIFGRRVKINPILLIELAIGQLPQTGSDIYRKFSQFVANPT